MSGGGMLPYGRQDVDDADIAAVVEALRSDWLTTGPAVGRFEDAVRAHCGAAHAVAVANGTAALHLACLALGLGPGDTVWTSPNTFVASANCARYCGAGVGFVDIDPATWNMSVAALEAKLRAEGPPQALVPVHFSGQPCDMAAIGRLAREYGFAVIEDASHAVGASWQGEPIGNCRHSDLVVFSFHPVKIVTSAEGGMVMAAREDLAHRLRLLRSHGIDRSAAATQGGWVYEQEELGFNYRLTDVQAALGASQVRRLDAFLARRRELAARYDRLLQRLPLVRPAQHPDGLSSWHLYVVRLPKNRRQVYDALRADGIGVQVHYTPVHLQPYYRRLGFAPGDFPEAEAYGEQALTLPLHPRMTDADQDRVVAALGKALA